VSLLRTLYRQRGLLQVLVARDLRARYRGTFLGYLWSMLNPLLLLTVYSVVFTMVMPQRGTVGVPYPLFLFAGLLPWMFASGALLDSAQVLFENGPLLKKVVCPAEVFPAVTVLSHLVHHLLALPVLLVALGAAAAVGEVRLSPTMLLLPVALLLWLAAVAGLVLAVSALAVVFRDLRDILSNLLNLVFFMTPIIYTPEIVPAGVLRTVVTANPVAPLVSVYRDVVLLGRIPGPSTWLAATAVAAVCLVLGVFIFERLRDTAVEMV
jgi:ABC-type polysaccharide/polyol phosphate export permease